MCVIVENYGALCRPAVLTHAAEVYRRDREDGPQRDDPSGVCQTGVGVWREGAAEQLPYDDNTFDLVVSRLALHHFTAPQAQLGEMVRVCKPGHMVGTIDLLSPDDEALRERYNHLERLRDPSHTTALTRTQAIRSMEEVGLSMTLVDTRDIPVDFHRWVTMTGTDRQNTATIQQALAQELDGGPATGMRPYQERGVLGFLQVWAVLIGTSH